MKMVCQPRTKNQRRNQVQMKLDVSSLAHTKWECKYHIVFAPKYRRQIIYGKSKQDIGQMIRKLCQYKGIEIHEAEACKDHIHRLMNISTMFLLLRNSSDCCLFAFASLPHMSISPRIIISVTFQQVDYAPDAKTGSEGNDEGLQHIDCAIEEIHILCAGIVSLWFLRWKPQSRNELAAVCGCRFRLLLSNIRLCFPPTLRFACVCCIVGVLLYGMGV